MGPLPSDEQAHMLTLSGILLVLGFMVLAPTILMMNNLEHSTERTQKDGIMADTNHLLFDLNESLQAAVPEANPDVSGFKNLSAAMQASLEEKASLIGLYASVSIAEDPPSDVYMQPSRCLGYDPVTTEEGVIVGWDGETQNAGIAGAVYDVHFTDGRQSFQSMYYIRFFECLQDVMFTHADDIMTGPGDQANFSASKKQDDRPMNLTETNKDPVLQDVSPRIDPDSFEIHHWAMPRNLDEEDGATSKYVSSNVRNNYVRFDLLAPTGMLPGDTLHDPEFQVTAGHNQAPWLDQDLYLQVYYPADATEPTISKEVGPLQQTLETFNLNLTRSPTGGTDWTYDEIVDSKWELTVIGDHNPEREIRVDHFNMTGGMFTSQPYRINTTLEWQEIPYIYKGHKLSLRYKIEPGTPDEAFVLQTRDVGPGGNDTWWDLTELEDTQGDWGSFESCLPLVEGDAKWLEFRLVDTNETDNQEPADEDTIQIDLIRVRSQIEEHAACA